MDLGNVIRGFGLSLLLAGAVQAEPYQTQLDLRGTTYELGDADGRCSISNGAGMLVLNIAAPCGFVRPAGQEVPQSFTYGAVRTVVLVAGPSLPDADHRQCSASGQPVIIDGRDVALGQARLIEGMFCHAQGLDEIIFRMVSDAGF